MLNELLMPLIMTMAIMGMQIILYFGCEKFQKNFHNVYKDIDNKIPLIPITCFIYVLWFPMIVIFPLFIYTSSVDWFSIYLISVVICNVISTPIYMLYSTTFERPKLPDTFGGKCLKIVYGCSYRGVNCMPSMHCEECYLMIICSILCPGLNLAVRAISIIISIGIVIATQTTKQHVLIDALTAIPVTLIAVLISYFAVF